MSGNADQWTIGRLLTWTADFLKRHGSQSPRLDAEVLLAHARSCRRIDLYTAFHEVVDESVRSTFRETVRQRSQGKPVAYLVGQREFYSLPFVVTPDVLIPRPETELVVVALIDRARARSFAAPLRIADVGTGSGILAICAARHLPGSHIVASDISDAALAVARQNAQSHGALNAIQFVKSDLFSSVPMEQFDFILSNPPYISDAEFESLSRDIKEYEPRLALVAGPTGMEVIEPLVAQSLPRLAPGGWLIFEISPMIAERVQNLLASRHELTDVRLERDLAGHHRVALARRA
jgi:release factor glutamine methyltransferase